MSRPEKKQKLTVYLDPDLMAALADLSSRRKHSLSLVAEAAVASFLSPDAEQRREAAFAKRLDRLDRRIGRLERDVSISNEAFALFMRSWLAATRYDQFLEALGRRLASGQTVQQEIADDIRTPSGGEHHDLS